MERAKIKECPSCAMESPEGVQICPICGYDYPKEPVWIKWAAILLLLIFLIFNFL